MTVSNRGPGTALRVLVHYDIPKGLRVGWGFPAQFPDGDPHGTAVGTTTCGWAPLGPDQNPEDGEFFHGTYDFCILSLEPGQSATFPVELAPPGGRWSARVDPLTPDIFPTNNAAESPDDGGVISPHDPVVISPNPPVHTQAACACGPFVSGSTLWAHNRAPAEDN